MKEISKVQLICVLKMLWVWVKTWVNRNRFSIFGKTIPFNGNVQVAICVLQRDVINLYRNQTNAIVGEKY